MRLTILPEHLSVYQVESFQDIDTSVKPLFIAQVDDEISVVSPTDSVPGLTLQREDDWRAFKFSEQLDFALVGVLARASTLLAEADISIFAVSTYLTDYVLVKSTCFDKAITVLVDNGYQIELP